MLLSMPSAPPPPSQQRTIAALLENTGREAVPIRRSFVQDASGSGPGPLARFVSHHDERALDLYLAFHAKASGGDYDVALPAPAWARVLGLSATDNGLTAVSKAWKRLEDMELISRGRSGRRARVVLLKEDGQGDDYVRPLTADDDRWFNLAHEYWSDGWFQRLDLPAKAMLLISLSLKNGFRLPFERAETWYGISRKTAQSGMKSLVDHDLIDRVDFWEEEPLSDIGHRQVIEYTLKAPFGPHPQKRPVAKKAPRPSAAPAKKAARKEVVKTKTSTKSVTKKKRAGREPGRRR